MYQSIYIWLKQNNTLCIQLNTYFFYISLCFTTTLPAQKSASGSQKNNKVVFIVVDGIAADMLKNNPTPRLDEIAKAGAYSDAYVGGIKEGYSETPTISAVGYNSLLTGVWANKHNVWGNSIKDPNYNYPTIFRLYKNTFPNGKTAIFSTWLDNRTKLIGEGLPKTDRVKVDYAFDGFELDSLRFPHDTIPFCLCYLWYIYCQKACHCWC